MTRPKDNRAVTATAQLPMIAKSDARASSRPSPKPRGPRHLLPDWKQPMVKVPSLKWMLSPSTRNRHRLEEA